MTPQVQDRLLDHLLPGWRDARDVRGERTVLCPLHADRSPSLRLKSADRTWFCDPCGRGGGAWDLAVAIHGNDAARRLLDEIAPKVERKAVATYVYEDRDGVPVYEVRRIEPGSNGRSKDFAQARIDPDGTRVSERGCMNGVERVPFHLAQLIEAVDRGVPIHIVEGEKDVLAIEAAGGVASCNPGGAGKWTKAMAKCLRGADVVIVADDDAPGMAHAVKVATSLDGIASSTKIVKAAEGDDASDHLAAGHSLDEFVSVDLNAEAAAARAEAGSTLENASANRDGERQSKAQLVIGLAIKALADDALFHDADGTAFVRLAVDDHVEVHDVRSLSIKRWFRRLMYEHGRQSLPTDAVNEAIETLAAIACFDGEQHEVDLRVAGDDEHIYLNLADDEWQQIEIDRDGWRIIAAADSPIRFRRAAGMRTLPIPQTDGSLATLRGFVNIDSDEDFILLVAFLVGALRPRGPYPILGLSGEQGSAKSTTSRVIRKLIDENASPIRSTPREERDLVIAAANGHVLAFDNVSDLRPWLSDAFCRIATGGGFGARKLYTDSDEVIFDATRPVILNGIGAVASRGDLVDRSLLIRLPAIPESKRRTESSFWREFDATGPGIFGALLDAVSTAIRNLDDVNLETIPRMADFAQWVVAAEPVLPWSAGRFLTAYSSNRASAVDSILEDDLVAIELICLLDASGDFEGTAKELLGILTEKVGEKAARAKTWPKTPRGIRSRLDRLAPAMRAAGIEIELPQSGDREGHDRRRTLRIQKVGPRPSASAASAAPGGNGIDSGTCADTPAVDCGRSRSVAADLDFNRPQDRPQLSKQPSSEKTDAVDAVGLVRPSGSRDLDPDDPNRPLSGSGVAEL